jgi:hypothetical protein
VLFENENQEKTLDTECWLRLLKSVKIETYSSIENENQEKASDTEHQK